MFVPNYLVIGNRCTHFIRQCDQGVYSGVTNKILHLYQRSYLLFDNGETTRNINHSFCAYIWAYMSAVC